MTAERLQKIIARAGVTSRRAAEALIEQGRVTVNGVVAKIGQSGDPKLDEIRVDGIRVELPDAYEYIALNKPRGVISDLDVSGEHANARDLIPLDGHLYPVGRLDLTSEGLMLFTNDGDLAHKLTHPRYEHPKTYHVVLAGAITVQAIERWRRGLIIEGKKTWPAEVTKLQKTRDGTVLEVTMREGRKRQIRKIASALGYPVISLTRTRIGPLALGDLPSGGWRRLSPEETHALLAVRRSPEPRASRTSRTKGSISRSSRRGTSTASKRSPSSKGRSVAGSSNQSTKTKSGFSDGEEQSATRRPKAGSGQSAERTHGVSSSSASKRREPTPSKDARSGKSQRPNQRADQRPHREGKNSTHKSNKDENDRP